MKQALTTLACLGLLGCGGGGASFDGSDKSAYSNYEMCSTNDIKSWVQHNMNDYYLFYDQVPLANVENYNDPEDYIRALRVAPYDRYSYVTDAATQTSFYEEGKRFGFGMQLERTADQRLIFTLIEPHSPLGATEAERGDELLAINGVTPNGFTAEFIDAALGVNDEAVTVTFTLRKPGNAEPYDVVVTKSIYDVQTVLDTKVFSHNNHQIGYLNFLSFLETSEQEINEAFAEFKQEEIDELVLDLRLNTGGRISIAEQIGSLIAGDAVRPFIDVVTIGDTTCGKPYGTTSNTYCGKSMNALQVDLLNAANVGGYYEGMPANCPVTEDLVQPLGEPSENLMQAALHHIDTAQCALPNTVLADGNNTTLRDRVYTSTTSSLVSTRDNNRQNLELLDHRFDEIRTLVVK